MRVSIYAGGSFSTAGGLLVNYVAQWNGNTWSPLGTGVYPWGVFALAVADTNLYVGGSFTSAGGQACGYVARAGIEVIRVTTSSPLPPGTAGTLYSMTLSAVGGTLPYSWAITSGGLPSGLSLSTNGVISGTPDAATNASCVLQVCDGSLAATRSFSLAINPATPAITTASPLPVGFVGTAYNQTLAATSSTMPYTWSITAGSLPEGLALSTNGVISGTPTTATNAHFTVQVIGHNGYSGTKVFDLSVMGDPLAAAVDSSGRTWTTGGNAPWFFQTVTTHDGVDAAQSGLITDGQESWMETTLTGSGTLSFWWLVSSESWFDYLEFYLDGVLQSGRISGFAGWQQQTISIPVGGHTAKWRYMKDESASVGQDAGWVDEVSFVPDPPRRLPSRRNPPV